MRVKRMRPTVNWSRTWRNLHETQGTQLQNVILYKHIRDSQNKWTFAHNPYVTHGRMQILQSKRQIATPVDSMWIWTPYMDTDGNKPRKNIADRSGTYTGWLDHMSMLRYLAEKESCAVDSGAARDIPSRQLPGNYALGIYQPHPHGKGKTVPVPKAKKASSRLSYGTGCVIA
jgi:hypothetical protein